MRLSFFTLLLLALSAPFSCLRSQSSYSQQWEDRMGGSAYEQGNYIDTTSDGGFIVTSRTASSDGDIALNQGIEDFWALRLRADGTVKWQRTYGGSGLEWVRHARQTSDGGFIVTGITNSNDGDVSGNHGGNDIWVLKLDSLGNIQWQKCLGGSGDDSNPSALEIPGGSFMVAGMTKSADGDVTLNRGYHDFWMLRLDSAGNITWQKTYGGSDDDMVAGYLQQTADGHYLLGGYTYSSDGNVAGYHGQGDMWVIKVDTAGSLLWQHCYGGGGEDLLESLHPTADNGLVISGITQSTDGDVSLPELPYGLVWIFKSNASGALAWQNVIGNVGGGDLRQTIEGDYAFASFSSQLNAVFAGSIFYKIDTLGNLGWPYIFANVTSGTVITQYMIYGQCETRDRGFVFTGVKSNSYNSAGYDLWVVKLGAQYTGIDELNAAQPVSVYPNPVSDRVFIRSDLPLPLSGYVLTDALGRTVQSGPLQGMEQSIGLVGLQQGLYILCIGGARFRIMKE